jgi:hypothetical protein
MTADDVLGEAIAAVRAAGDEVDAGAPQATVLRVRRSLEARARRPRVWAAIAAALGISSIGGVAFAIVTGRLVIGAKAEPHAIAPAAAQVRDVAPQQARAHRALRAATAPITAPAPIELPAPAPPAPPVRPAPSSVRPERSRRTEIEAAYRRAHELHFRGADPAAALAAWDDYLRVDPSGRFAAEARFNRAIDLIRLGRYDQARAALAPFARGDEPNGYRHDDAQRLLDRLDAIGAPDSTIVDAPGTPR